MKFLVTYEMTSVLDKDSEEAGEFVFLNFLTTKKRIKDGMSPNHTKVVE